ncbi:fumarate/nitrate reduction transcriptional regulator Fnr [Halomonas sp. CKK8]|uniref:fumarate/nitrate reduction transcriptional regulator Fnr n=1 Tax=Halomonas sp. CKK8 TaxID=3036127 RepID=UPI0024158B38|nr:fumarate/nitrate reduction transcriptional regulator Fnr [Halomonas sp. CKK8]WFM72260.1 fumarate/nitrate reduction transcriptional regulator Fnr [Halomonas sp. CKK8]
MTHLPTGQAAMPSGQVSRCQGCSLCTHCLPLGLAAEDLEQFDAIIRRPRPLKRGALLMRQGQPFTSLYVVRSGSFKQVVGDVGYRENVTHFLLPSEMAGLDAVGEAIHPTSVVALESSFVCELPFASLEALGNRLPALRGAFYRCMSQELHRDQRLHCLLAFATAERRLASFLMDMSERHAARGYSPYGFQLAMSRADIGSFLGLALETVSRLMSRFQRHGLLELRGREVTLLDLTALEALAEEAENRR